MSGSVKDGIRERLESPTKRVDFRTSNDQSCIFLKVRGCVCGSGRPGEPGVAAETLFGMEVDNSDVWVVISFTLFIFPFLIIVVLVSTSVIGFPPQGSAANSSGSLCCL